MGLRSRRLGCSDVVLWGHSELCVQALHGFMAGTRV